MRLQNILLYADNLLLLLLLWQCDTHRYADIIKFSGAVYTL